MEELCSFTSNEYLLFAVPGGEFFSFFPFASGKRRGMKEITLFYFFFFPFVSLLFVISSFFLFPFFSPKENEKVPEGEFRLPSPKGSFFLLFAVPFGEANSPSGTKKKSSFPLWGNRKEKEEKKGNKKKRDLPSFLFPSFLQRRTPFGDLREKVVVSSFGRKSPPKVE
jgi:hypothetical protein